jgi:hypothetical protein
MIVFESQSKISEMTMIDKSNFLVRFKDETGQLFSFTFNEKNFSSINKLPYTVKMKIMIDMEEENLI